MLQWRILYYLFQFYLFVASGALSYLSLRAWLDPTLSRRKREDPYRVRNWTHLLRGLGLLAVAVAAVIGSLREGAVGISLNAVALLRIGGFAFLLFQLPKPLWRERTVWIGSGLIAVGEALLYMHSNHVDRNAGDFLRNLTGYAGLALDDLGLGLLGYRMARTILRVRLVDRLVIAIAVFSLIVSQIVAFLTVGLLSSFSADMAKTLSEAERPLIMCVSAVVILGAWIGYFLARDVSDPVTRLGKTLRSIGEGNFNEQVKLSGGSRDDEMSDLALEVNRMAGQLKDADELRADFFSFVSHELRTPLTSIKGFITTLESVEDFSPSERAEMYSIVHGETDRLLRMINELLDLSRIQSGKPLKLNCEWFDLGSHLSKIARTIATDSQRHRIELAAPETPVWLFADPDKVSQIVINLMSNAVKYSPSGGVVTVSLRQTQSLVEIAVSDQGVGMTSDQCAHVFDKFYRVAEQDGAEGAKRLRRVEGAGIGLYLTRALVEAHQGKVAVESVPGEGSVFTVSLPRQIEGTEYGEEAGDSVIRHSNGRSRGLLLDGADREKVPHLVGVRGEEPLVESARDGAGSVSPLNGR